MGVPHIVLGRIPGIPGIPGIRLRILCSSNNEVLRARAIETPGPCSINGLSLGKIGIFRGIVLGLSGNAWKWWEWWSHCCSTGATYRFYLSFQKKVHLCSYYASISGQAVFQGLLRWPRPPSDVQTGPSVWATAFLSRPPCIPPPCSLGCRCLQF